MGEKTEDYSKNFKSKNLVEDVTYNVEEEGQKAENTDSESGENI